MLTYPAFRRYLMTHRPPGSLVTPHSMRKGAVLRMLKAGMTLKDISYITQHRTVDGLMSYVTLIDKDIQRRMARASAAIAGATS